MKLSVISPHKLILSFIPAACIACSSAAPVPWSETSTLQLQKNLKQHVYILSEKIGDRSTAHPSSLSKADAYIFNKLTEYGYTPVRQKYEADSVMCSNIIAVKKGAALPDEFVVAGAHYDSCANPGADDNASGTAGLIELARLSVSAQTRRSIEFVFFTNEEPPFFKTGFMGSAVYARHARLNGKIIRGAVILEMIGYFSDRKNSQHYPCCLFPIFYPTKGNYISIVSNLSNSSLAGDIKKSFQRQSSFPVESLSAFQFIPGIDFSDHWSFYENGYPAVMVTDTSFYRNSNYHRNTDTFDTLDYPRMAEVVKGTYTALLDLSEK